MLQYIILGTRRHFSPFFFLNKLKVFSLCQYLPKNIQIWFHAVIGCAWEYRDAKGKRTPKATAWNRGKKAEEDEQSNGMVLQTKSILKKRMTMGMSGGYRQMYLTGKSVMVKNTIFENNKRFAR